MPAFPSLAFRAGLAAALLAAAAASRAQPASAPAAAASAPARPIFVLNSQDATISVVDPVRLVETKRIPTGKEPHHLYLTPDEKSLVVANAAGDSLTFVDPATAEVQRTVTGIADPYHLRFSPDMKWFVTASNRLDRLDIYRWNGLAAGTAQPLVLVARLPAPRTPSHLAIDSKSRTLYASLQDSDELLAVDLATQKPRWKIPVGKMPADVYLAPDDRTLLVAMTGDEVVEAYDVSAEPARLVKRIRTGAGAHAFRSRGDGRHVFVSNRVANTVSLIDLQTLEAVERYAVPGGPDCMDLTADGRLLYATSRWARRLSVVDLQTKRVVQSVPVGRSPHGVWTLDHASRR
jgi:YVTN family beta-propeller protein